MSDELRVVVTAAVKDAIRDLKLTDKTFDSTAKRIKRQIADLNKIGTNLTRYLTLPIAGAAVASVKFAADLEKQQVAFETLLGSAERGAKLFEELKKFSAETPLQLEDIASGAQTLLAFGTSADDVVSRLQMLGDVAQGDAGKLDALVNAYGKLQAKGKASLEEINRFTENGVPLVAELARQFGVTTEELLKMVSAGKVRFPDVDKALRALTSTGGQFHGMMLKISQTTTGKLSTALDNLKLSAAKLGESLLPLVNKLIDGIGTLAEKFGAMDESGQKALLITAGIAAAAGPILKTAAAVATLVTKLGGLAAVAGVAGPVAAIAGPAVAAGLLARRMSVAAAADVELQKADVASNLRYRKAYNIELLKSLDVYLALARQHGLSIDQVFEIGRAEGVVTKELENQLRLWKQAQSLTEEDMIANLEALGGGTGPAPGAAPTDAGGDAVRTWQSWFEEVTGTEVVGKAGAEAARRFLDGLGDELERDRTIAEALGEKFDMASALGVQQEQIHSVVTELLSIDPSLIDEPFRLWNASLGVLTGGYKDLSGAVGEIADREAAAAAKRAAVEAQKAGASLKQEVQETQDLVIAKSALDEAMDRERENIQQTRDQWGLYWEVTAKLQDPTLPLDQLAILEGIRASLEEQLGIEEAITAEQERQAELRDQEEAAAAEERARAEEQQQQQEQVVRDLQGTLVDALGNAGQALGEVIAKGGTAAEAIEGVGAAAVEALGSVVDSIPQLLLQSGQVVPAIIAAILIGVAKGIGLFHITPDDVTNYADLIITEEERLAEERVRILQETLEREREIRDAAMADLEDEFSREFDVIRDAWQRNLITTEQFLQQTQALNEQYQAQEDVLNQPVEEAETAIDAEEQAKQDLENARQTKLSDLASQALAIQTALNAMTDWQKFWTGTDEQYAKDLDLLDARMEVVRNARSIAEINAARTGADFITNGPRMLMVGDNPGGRERVSVTPIGSPNLRGPSGTPIVQLVGNVYGVEHLTEEVARIWDRLERRRRIAR